MTVFRNREMAKQLNDFSGLENKGRIPSDIDGLGDYRDENVFVFIEVKYGNAVMKYGQKCAYQAVSDACEDAGKISVVLVAQHLIPSPFDVPVDLIPVKLIRMHKRWFAPKKPLTVKEAIEKLLATKTLTGC